MMNFCAKGGCSRTRFLCTGAASLNAPCTQKRVRLLATQLFEI